MNVPMPDDWAELLAEDPDDDYDPSENSTQLIKTVASAYFIHIPDDTKGGIPYWINLANAISVFRIGEQITIKFTDRSAMTLTGLQKETFLRALGEVTR